MSEPMSKGWIDKLMEKIVKENLVAGDWNEVKQLLKFCMLHTYKQERTDER